MDSNKATRIGEAILEEYSLQYGNAEAVVQDGTLLVDVEAPNHTTVPTTVKITSNTTIKDIVSAVQDSMFEFDPNEEFKSLEPTNEFWEHNHCEPLDFTAGLADDTNFFKGTIPKMKVEDIEEWLRDNPDTEGGD